MTHAEAADKYGITRARVGQIVKPADTRAGARARAKASAQAKKEAAREKARDQTITKSCPVCGDRFRTTSERRVTCGKVWDPDTGETCGEAWRKRRHQFDPEAKNDTYDNNALTVLRHPLTIEDPHTRGIRLRSALRRVMRRGLDVPTCQDGEDAERDVAQAMREVMGEDEFRDRRAS